MKKVLIFLAFAILIALLALFFGYTWYQQTIHAKNTDAGSTPVVFEVKLGDSTTTVSANLVSAKLVSDRRALDLYFRFNPDKAKGIKAGIFSIAPDLSIIDIVELLQNATTSGNDLKITIPEGLRSDEIATILDTAFNKNPGGNFDKKTFMSIVTRPEQATLSDKAKLFLADNLPQGKSLEGFLYPDTYLFDPKASAGDVVNKLVETLAGKITAADNDALKQSSFSMYDVITLASILERESLHSTDAPTIADILIRRLDGKADGTKLLGLDSPLLYAAKDWKADATQLKKKDGTYNTYLHPGLPPTPISNPGMGTIRAVLSPAPNDYLYYLYDKDGGVHYAKILAEHTANIRKYH